MARPPNEERTLDITSVAIFLKDPEYSACLVEAVKVADFLMVRYKGRDVVVSIFVFVFAQLVVALRLLLRALLTMATV